MDKRKLLIVDSSEDFQHALAEALCNDYHVSCCQDGKEALAWICRHQPDILLLELTIPSLDGISLLQALENAGIMPIVLAFTVHNSIYVMQALTRLRVGYIMIKPCDIQATIQRVHDLANQEAVHTLSAPDPYRQAGDILNALGFAAKHRGYAYLQSAIVLYSRNPGMSITKELYPAVANDFSVVQANVEHSIRTAIEFARKKGDAELWAALFPPEVNRPALRPTNSTFISRIAQELHTNS